MNKNFVLKIKESLSSVLPITGLVLLLHFTIAPMPTGTLVMFIMGALLLIFGMGLFTLGADTSMMIMGEKIGSFLTKSQKLWLIIPVSFLMGMMITIAEPDLQVLADQTPGVPNMVIILCVAIGVGIFLVISLLRTLFQIKLSYILITLYFIVFILASFTPKSFLAVAFDSGGVTTGPITVPFIMALGIGMANVRSDKTSREDSFGLVALCSVGPILAVTILGLFYKPSASEVTQDMVTNVANFKEIIQVFAKALPIYAKEVMIALLPIIIFFLIFQSFTLKLHRKQLIKIGIGVIYTYFGLVLFLTGVNVGFMPAGYLLGQNLITGKYNMLLIPIGMIIGFLIVAAEPAVHVLNEQVEDISEGSISKRSMLLSLSIGVAISVGLSMLRISTGLSIWFLLIPGYAIAIILTFIVPPIFTSIAFDSGGVASGPMTATFLLPLAMGACNAIGGDILIDAFGIVAMVAMTPLITIQILGLVSKIKANRSIPITNEELSLNDDFIYYEEIISYQDETKVYDTLEEDNINDN